MGFTEQVAGVTPRHPPPLHLGPTAGPTDGFLNRYKRNNLLNIHSNLHKIAKHMTSVTRRSRSPLRKAGIHNTSFKTKQYNKILEQSSIRRYLDRVNYTEDERANNPISEFSVLHKAKIPSVLWVSWITCAEGKEGRGGRKSQVRSQQPGRTARVFGGEHGLRCDAPLPRVERDRRGPNGG